MPLIVAGSSVETRRSPSKLHFDSDDFNIPCGRTSRIPSGNFSETTYRSSQVSYAVPGRFSRPSMHYSGLGTYRISNVKRTITDDVVVGYLVSRHCPFSRKLGIGSATTSMHHRTSKPKQQGSSVGPTSAFCELHRSCSPLFRGWRGVSRTLTGRDPHPFFLMCKAVE